MGEAKIYEAEKIIKGGLISDGLISGGLISRINIHGVDCNRWEDTMQEVKVNVDHP
jgi:hypothetical protein